MHKGAVKLAGWIFAIMALVHLYRLYFPFSVVVADHVVPQWASAVWFVVGGLLSAWLFRSLHCDKACQDKKS